MNSRRLGFSPPAGLLLFAPALWLAAGSAAIDSRSGSSEFNVKLDAGAITSLQSAQDRDATEFVAPGGRLGEVLIQYRRGDGPWRSANTSELADRGTYSTNHDGADYQAVYDLTNDPPSSLVVETRFTREAGALVWTIRLKNTGLEPVEVGDLALPLPMSRGGAGGPVILKHSFISGNGSFLFWMRSDSAAPLLALVPDADTHLEYWDTRGAFGRGGRGYRVYIHSSVAGAKAREEGTHWRQPNTRLMLAPMGQPGDARAYGFKFRFARDEEGVRQLLVEEGKIDVQVVPGMTVPTNLFAEFALRTTQPIQSIAPEYPKQTKIEPLGAKGEAHLFKVQFSKLGENELTVHYGSGQQLFLEFFSTEPLETLILKRGAFLARSQHRDPAQWYDGLITDWNMDAQKLISPNDYAPIPRSRVYAVTCDDPGLGKPAFLAAKNAEYPVQSEVEALDYYIGHFVWGGLQRTTNESYAYAIYGIPNWKTNRDSPDPGRNGRLHVWREYDYPHVIQMYFGMYRLANDHPEIKTALTARDYLLRAYGTASAFFTIPHEVWSGWSPYGTGFYNELVIVDLIDALHANGLNDEAAALRTFWERKVKSFVNREQDLFRSEYAFDSTGFESTQAIARYAMQRADQPGETNFGITLANAKRFLEKQIAANIFCRGWLEPAYYYLGSDYRGSAGNAYVLTYMSQMGGWSVLDYALNFATNPAPYLRLGYASYLSAWALMNTGTPESNYGYWYPGRANDGGAGGGFEPAPFGQTWLGQPHHRGSWYFSSEIDLGYCGALRTAATILADDPLFGRFCFGGDWSSTPKGIQIVPKDGVRRRLDALLGKRNVQLILDNDRFAAAQPIELNEDFSNIQFQLESGNSASHHARLHFTGLPSGRYRILAGNAPMASLEINEEHPGVVELPVVAGIRPSVFAIVRQE